MDKFATFHDKNFRTETEPESTINYTVKAWFYQTCFTKCNLFVLKL